MFPTNNKTSRLQRARSSSEKIIRSVQASEEELDKEKQRRKNGRDIELTKALVSKVVENHRCIDEIIKEAAGAASSYFACERTRIAFVHAAENLICDQCKTSLLSGRLSEQTKACLSVHLSNLVG